jgi:hypothetical protein
MADPIAKLWEAMQEEEKRSAESKGGITVGAAGAVPPKLSTIKAMADAIEHLDDRISALEKRPRVGVDPGVS